MAPKHAHRPVLPYSPSRCEVCGEPIQAFLVIEGTDPHMSLTARNYGFFRPISRRLVWKPIAPPGALSIVGGGEVSVVELGALSSI